MSIPFYQALLDPFDGGGNVLNRECDGAERLFWLVENLFHLASTDNGICMRMGKFGTLALLDPGYKYMRITNKQIIVIRGFFFLCLLGCGEKRGGG